MKKNEDISRRDFLKMSGAAAATAAFLAACEGDAKKAGVSSTPLETGEMTYRKGPDGDKVSLLGYGCMRWPTVKDGNGKDIIDQETVNQLVDYAIEHGITYFDTAPMYVQAQSEPATGIALKRHDRKEFYVATKLSNQSIAHTFEAAKTMYDNSFKRLQVDYIDYYLLHNISRGVDIYRERFIDNGVIDFLLKEREAGRIRHLGFSFHGDQETLDAILADHEKYHWDFVQIQMNYVDWIDYAEGFYNSISAKGIPVIVMEPLLGGGLASVNDHATGLLKNLQPHRSIASWAFRFCGNKPQVLTVLSGMTYLQHLQDNLQTFSPLASFSEEEENTLKEVAQEVHDFPSIPCTGCQYCMPCPYGVNIPAVFKHYNKCLNEGNVKSEKGDPAYRKARRAYLVSLDRNVETLRQANHCIGCRKCTAECPQSINIPQQMQRIDAFTETLKRNG